jgi:hypothetical protein
MQTSVLFPQDAVAAVNTDETGGNCSLRPEEAATVYLDETVQVSMESSVRLSLSFSFSLSVSVYTTNKRTTACSTN